MCKRATIELPRQAILPSVTLGTRSSFAYKVLDGSETVLTVAFGNGQFGTSHVRTPTGSRIGTVTRWPVGEGAALRGKAARIRSIVTDINDSTDTVSAWFELSGGIETVRVRLHDRVGTEGESKVFDVTVHFV